MAVLCGMPQYSIRLEGVRYQNSVPKVFIATSIDVVVCKFRKIWPSGTCVIYQTEKNFAFLSYCRYCADRVQNLPGRASDNVPSALQISS